MKAETPKQRENRLAIEATCRNIGRSIVQAIGDKRLGFALMMFDFGDGGNMAYMSNAKREDFIKSLKELLVMLQGEA